MPSAPGSTRSDDHCCSFAQLRQITAAVDVPVTADLEGGYGLDPSELVDALLDAGAVGCNIEDTDHAAGDGLLDARTQAIYLAGIRAAADERGVGIVLNARIDAIVRHPQRDPAAALEEVLRRAHLYLEAGADCVYPIGLRAPAPVAEVVSPLDDRRARATGQAPAGWRRRCLQVATARALVTFTRWSNDDGAIACGCRSLPGPRVRAARGSRPSAACAEGSVGAPLTRNPLVCWR